jgi:hypothetical protein
MCAYGATIVVFLFRGHILEKKLDEVVFFNRHTGEEMKASYTIIVQYLFNTFTLESATLLLMVVMGFALGLFLGYHIYLTSLGMTTNESYKWSDVRKWHKSELKRYNDALKKRQPIIENYQKVQPIVGDGDITCTPGSGPSTGASNGAPAPNPADAVQDPGPMPRNIYDRGFMENWKEVIFPLSLQKINSGPNDATTEDRPTASKTKAT